MASSVLDVVSAPASAIGRYFSVLSVVPSSLVVVYVFGLVNAAPWRGRPDWQAAGEAFGELGFGGGLALGLVGLLIGLVLQPLQYAAVQFCEGYWGPGPLAQAVMARRILHHRKRRGGLVELQGESLHRLRQAKQSPTEEDADWVDDDHLADLVAFEESSRLLTFYPRHRNDVRPTRLGNVLRRHERTAGAAYDLPGVSVAPHLTLVAPTADVAYLSDQRTQLDLAVRLSTLSAIATVITALMFWRSGLWLALALAPYAATYLFYRGAVSLAQGYGTALTTLVDLNRFALHDRMRIEAPRDTRAERDANRAIGRLLRDAQAQDLPLAPPPVAAGGQNSPVLPGPG